MIKEAPQIISIEPVWEFEGITQEQWITGSKEDLQQRIIVLLDEAKKANQTEAEKKRLREQVTVAEEVFDIDLNDLIDNPSILPFPKDETPYSAKVIDAKINKIKSQYQEMPEAIFDEMEKLARSAWRSLESNYRREKRRQEQEEIRSGIQKTTELIAAEKDALIGLVRENLSRYPDMTSTMDIKVGQFNREHVGLKDDNTVSKKFKALHQIGVLLDYQPGEVDKSNPDDIITSPAKITLNPEMVLNPSKIKKPDDMKAGGDRQTICKIPDCPGNDPHNEAEHRSDKYALEYCHLTNSVALDSLPGLQGDSDIHRALKAIEEGRIYITEQLHRFAENGQKEASEAQKHNAFGDNKAPAFPQIYVDEIKTVEGSGPYIKWCQMATDGPIEILHNMAEKLRLKREWFKDDKNPHYNLTPTKRKQALSFGAIPISSSQLIERCYQQKKHPEDLQKHYAFGQIYHIGYREPGALEQIEKALELDPTLTVVDIRYVDGSRNPLWTGEALQERFKKYVWIKNLGNLKYKEQGSIQIANPESGLEELKQILSKHSVILLCGCPDYETCHRKTVGELLKASYKAEILPLSLLTDEKIHCAECKIDVDQAPEIYFTDDGACYCGHHGPQALSLQVGQRVSTPAGPGTILRIMRAPISHEIRCSITTDKQQPDGSHYQVYDLSQISAIKMVEQKPLI